METCFNPVVGALSGRITFESYLAWACFNIAWVYPLVVHWIWSEHGWLSSYAVERGGCVFGDICAVDFAGGIVVHVSGTNLPSNLLLLTRL